MVDNEGTLKSGPSTGTEGPQYPSDALLTTRHKMKGPPPRAQLPISRGKGVRGSRSRGEHKKVGARKRVMPACEHAAASAVAALPPNFYAPVFGQDF